MYTEGGKWKHEGPAWTHWCDGFLPGMMWVFYKHLGPDNPESKFWMEQAIRYSKPLEQRKLDRDVHDLGSSSFPPIRARTHLPGTAPIREVGCKAAGPSAG